MAGVPTEPILRWAQVRNTIRRSGIVPVGLWPFGGNPHSWRIYVGVGSGQQKGPAGGYLYTHVQIGGLESGWDQSRDASTFT